MIVKNERFDVTICNPPFHISSEAAQKSTLRKLNNLNDKKVSKPVLNFGGQNVELWCDGGERKFVSNMIRQSKKFAESCYWFSSLISKQSNLEGIYQTLKNVDAVNIITIPMGQGNKTSRIVAWTFLTPTQQKIWKQTRWKPIKTKRD